MIDRHGMLEISADEVSNGDQLEGTPLVSVLMLAYNHGEYIEQAVESVMAQEASFGIELLIGDDLSNDDTLSVCHDLLRRFPKSIRLITAAVNVGIENNFLRLLCRARGRYIALLEGDDYWTVNDKLSAQVALLSSNPQYSWCGTRTANREFWGRPKRSYNLSDVLRRYIVHTSSVLMRSDCLNSWPSFQNVVCLDNLLFAYLSEQGLCGFIDRETSYYRRHAGGIWSGTDSERRLVMTTHCIDAMNEHFSGRYRRELADREIWIYGMEVSLDLGLAILPQWLHSLRVSRLAVRRTFANAPLACTKFLLGVALQPLSGGYRRLRRALGLGQRLRRLLVSR